MPNEDPMQQVTFRIPGSWLERADRLAGDMTKRQPAMPASRTDAIRVALLRGLELLEKGQPK